MHLSQKASKVFFPLVLTSAIAAAITGCNGGSSSGDGSAIEKDTVQVQSTSTFSAIYMGQVDHNTEHQASAVDAERLPQAVTYFEGTLTAVDAATNTPQEFDWPLVLGEDGMVTSQKTVTLEPGTYDFTLMVKRGSQQYTAVLLQYPIDDQGEYRLDFQLDPVAGDTIVDFDNVKLMSRLKLEFPSDELASIDAPQIGLIVDGVETIYQLNKSTGIADISLNYQGGTHTYDVNLYNGNQLIGRSALGPQSVDLELNTDFTLDLISLQADITVDISNLSEPNFIFKIPQEVIDHVGDAANVNLMARITDNENVQEITLPVELVDGKYQASHTFGPLEGSQVAAYLEFLDITDGGSEIVSTCADSINVSQPNELDCAVEIAKDYVVGGNLLATLSINVLDENKVAQSGAQVFVNGELVGITGDNFGTAGFVKTHVKAGEEHLALAKKNDLEDSHTLTPGSLSINNFDLILSTATPAIDGISCKGILDSGNSVGTGLYTLDVDGDGPLDSFETFCDMDNDGGGWTLVQNRRNFIDMTTSYNLTGPIEYPDTDIEEGLPGAISNDSWLALRSLSSEIKLYAGGNTRLFYTTFDRLHGIAPEDECVSWEEGSSNLLNHLLFHSNPTAGSCTPGATNESNTSSIGHPGHADKHASAYSRGNTVWIEHHINYSATTAQSSEKTSVFVR